MLPSSACLGSESTQNHSARMETLEESKQLFQHRNSLQGSVRAGGSSAFLTDMVEAAVLTIGKQTRRLP